MAHLYVGEDADIGAPQLKAVDTSCMSSMKFSEEAPAAALSAEQRA